MAEVKMKDWLPFPKEGEKPNYFQTEKSDEEEVKEILGVDSSVDEEYDEGFEAWLKELSEMSAADAKANVWEIFKSRISEEDAVCCEKIMEILNDPDNRDKNTDLVFVEKELKKINSEINPIAVFNYLLILQGLHLIKLD